MVDVIADAAAASTAEDDSWGEVPETSTAPAAQPEQQEETPAKPAEPPVWKQKQPEHIPYARFAEQSAQLQEMRENAARVAAELERYRAMEKQQAEIPADPDKLDMSKFVKDGEPDVEGYLKAYAQAARLQAQQEAEKTFAEKWEAQQRQAAQNALLADYGARLEEHAKVDPDIREKEEYVVGVLSSPANQRFLPPGILHELATDKHSAAIIAHLADNPDDLRSLLHPGAGLRALHQLSYIVSQQGKQAAQTEQAEPDVPAFRAPTPQVKPRVMAQIPGGGPATKRDPYTMSQKEYAAWRRKQDAEGRSSDW